jgi:cell wall-associated protease
MRSNSKVSLGFLVAISLIAGGSYSHHTHAQLLNNKVLVIDEGVDLNHNELKNRAYVNLAELRGIRGFDDDRNGFIDDISGWNAVSNDNQYFPDWIRETFEKNNDLIVKLLALYDRIEEGDEEAKNLVYGNPNIANAMSAILSWSHGTHVGGIVVRYGNPNAEIASLNVFSSSKDPSAATNAPQTIASNFENGLRLENSIEKVRRGLEQMRVQLDLPDVTIQTSEFRSIFDDTDGVLQYIQKLRADALAEKRLLSRYTLSVKPKVVNLSLGSSKVTIRQALDSMWEDELLRANKPIDTRRSALQEQNYQRLLHGAFEAFRASWNEFFKNNPETLFVVAAGNDAGDKNTPNAGNNGINEVVPANCSRDNANVITVAATNKEGLIADFSNFNANFVNIGAWGTAVPSAAPNNTNVKMSGTSMAAPNVAGLASRLSSVNRKLTPVQMRRIMEGTVRKVASLEGRVSSNGLMDPQAALDAARRTLFTNLETAITESVRLRSHARTLQPFTLFPNDLFVNEPNQKRMHITSPLVKDIMKARSKWQSLQAIEDALSELNKIL